MSVKIQIIQLATTPNKLNSRHMLNNTFFRKVEIKTADHTLKTIFKLKKWLISYSDLKKKHNIIFCKPLSHIFNLLTPKIK